LGWEAYPEVTDRLITADGGGGNTARCVKRSCASSPTPPHALDRSAERVLVWILSLPFHNEPWLGAKHTRK